MIFLNRKRDKEIFDNPLRADVFWETEVRANRLMAWGMLGVALFLTLYSSLMFIGGYGYDPRAILVVLAIELILLVPLGIYCLCVKGKKRWLKHIMMLAIILATTELQISFPLETLLLLLLPVVLSAQYYAVGYTRTTAIVMGALYVIAVWVGNKYGIVGDYDLNYYMLPPGTVLNAGEGAWIADLVLAEGIKTEYLLPVMMLSSVPPKLVVYALASAISVVVARRGRRMVLLEAEASAERAIAETELALASKIQLSELPCKFPAYPSHPNIDLFAMMIPAKEVGGDYYDFFEIDGDHVAFLVADVSGKGIPGALFMMRGKTLMKNYLSGKSIPSEAMTEANAHLSARNEESLFITAWVGVLEVSTNKLTYVNAGHCRPLLRHRGETAFTFLEPLHDLPLACFDNTKYTQSEIQLGAGDELFLYTDGVTEATNLLQKMYGSVRMSDFMNSHGDSPLQELLPALRNDVDAFVGEAPQFDDITMLMLRL